MQRDRVKPQRVHIIGAGLAGLSAAVTLADRAVPVTLYEGNKHAGGRCRSYFDARLGLSIDNGNHLVLSGNHETAAYIDLISARDQLKVPSSAAFPFVDLATQERWTMKFNDGRLPWWIFRPECRPPGTTTSDYFSLARLMFASNRAAIGDVISPSGEIYSRFIEPLMVAALNVEAARGSVKLAKAVMHETFSAGGRQCYPLIVRSSLASTFIDPALEFVASRGGVIQYGRRLINLLFEDEMVRGLEFNEGVVPVAVGEAVILAVTPAAAERLVPRLQTPNEFSTILNFHFRFSAPSGLPSMTGVVNGLTQWLFCYPDRLSVTISAADAELLATPRAKLVERVWREICDIADIGAALPAWQLVREQRATFAGTAEQDARRPPARTSWSNLHLAGDWIQTGLPATIESAIRSGNIAAKAVTAEFAEARAV